MEQLFISIVAFIIAVGVVVTFHEYGHYLVARLCQVKIIRFSIGYGKALWQRCWGKDRTQWVIAAIPLGGYVMMLDEEYSEVAPEERHRTFNACPLWQRLCIIIAGPLFNLLLAVLLWTLVFMIGVQGLRPLVYQVMPDSVAAQSGLRAGDEIISVNATRIATGRMFYEQMQTSFLKQESTVIQVRDSYGDEREVTLPIANYDFDDLVEQGNATGLLGIRMQGEGIPPVIGKVEANSAAALAGLLPGDTILAADGEPVMFWQDLVSKIQAKAGIPIALELRRDGSILRLIATPAATKAGMDEPVVGRLGVSVEIPEDYPPSEWLATQHWSLAEALARAMMQTREYTILTVTIIGRMFRGDISPRHLSGPIGIADYAGKVFYSGLVDFLNFMAIVSVNIGVLNMLPLPPLDGGRLLLLLYEGSNRRPLPRATQQKILQFGIFVLVGLLFFVICNDIIRLL